MARFLIVRLLQLPVILAIIYLGTFFLAWVAPGSPFERQDRKLDPRAMVAIEQRLHAEHWYTFLGYYPWQIIRHGDFGPSLNYEEFTVNDILKKALKVSMTLGALAMALAATGGVLLGTLAAVRRGGAVDWLSLGVALVGISLPSFVVAAMLMIVFAVEVRWFPVGGWDWQPGQMVLPAVALALMPMAYIARLSRVAMLDVLGADYVRTARAKGLSWSAVIWKHCLRNAFLPVLTYLGPAAAATLTGSFVVERVFNLPGMGQYFVDAVLNRDQTLVLGAVMVYSTILLVLNLAVDVCYGLVDPRIDVNVRN